MLVMQVKEKQVSHASVAPPTPIFQSQNSQIYLRFIIFSQGKFYNYAVLKNVQPFNYVLC